MKKKFLVKMFSVFVALALVNSSVVLAKVKQKKVEQKADEKKLSPEKQKEEDIEKIEETLKKYGAFEEHMQEILLEKFKDFKKEDYELKDYDLRVLKKGNVPILFYTHKKTGAQIYFSLSLEKEKRRMKNLFDFFEDELIFRVPCKDDRGLTKFTKNCFANYFMKDFIKNSNLKTYELNAYANLENLTFSSSVEVFGFNEQLEKEYIEKLTKELTSPSVFEKENEIFEVEKKRMLNKQKDEEGSNYSLLERDKFTEFRDFKVSGDILELEKLTLDDLKNFYEENIHPSNCLLIKNVFELNPQKIKDYLNLWNENYFSHFEKKETTDEKYEVKDKEKYQLIKWAKDSTYFKVYDEKTKKRKEYDYFASITFDDDFLNAIQRQIYGFGTLFFEKELNEFVKSLGYENAFINFGFLRFFGNEAQLFEQEILEENSKKIMNFVAEKLKNLDEKEFLYQRHNGLKFLGKNEFEKFKNTSFENFSRVHLGSPISYLVRQSFNETKKPISDKFFMFKDKDELEFSRKVVDDYLKQNLKSNLNAYKVFAEKGPKYITVLEKSNKKDLKEQFSKDKNQYDLKERVLPIKFKEKSPKKFVKDFAIVLLSNFLDEELNYKKGLVYKKFIPFNCLEDDFLIKYKLNKESVKALEDYVFKNFNEIMKNFNLKDEELKKLKEQYEKEFNSFKEQYQNQYNSKDSKKLVEDLKKYIKTGKIEKGSFLDVDNLTIGYIFASDPTYLLKSAAVEDLFTGYENFEEYDEYFEREMAFKEKYKGKFDEKITPEFVKDFLENLLEPALKKLEKAFKLAEEKLKALDSIKFSDVEDLIKTAYLVEDKEELEKVNQNLEKKVKRVEEYGI